MQKTILALACLAGSANAAAVVGEYGDGNTVNDAGYATVVGGDYNTVCVCVCDFFCFFAPDKASHTKMLSWDCSSWLKA